MRKIIDVSSYQGVVNWSKVKSDGVEGGIIKIIRKDLGKDNQFDNNYKGLIENNMPWGVYNYSYANTVAKAKSDANLVCDILDKLDTSNMIYGVWFDFEDNGTFGNKTKNQCTDIARAFCDTVANRGYIVGVYCNKEYYYKLNNFGMKNWWGARYPSTAVKNVDYTPNDSYKPNFVDLFAWQYSSTTKVNGVNGKTDISILYRDIELPKKENTKKDIDTIAKEVLDGKWGNSPDRKGNLEKQGYNYSEVQNAVNNLINNKTIKYYPQYKGTSISIVVALESIGVKDLSKSHRKLIAQANGINNYKGTAQENTSLVKLVKQGKLIHE